MYISNLHPDQIASSELGVSTRSFVGSFSRTSMMHMAENVILSDHLVKMKKIKRGQ